MSDIQQLRSQAVRINKFVSDLEGLYRPNLKLMEDGHLMDTISVALDDWDGFKAMVDTTPITKDAIIAAGIAGFARELARRIEVELLEAEND